MRRRLVAAHPAWGQAEIPGCVGVAAAHGAGLLFAARALSGAAVGAATSAGGAALIDLQPDRSGRGPVVTSAAVLLGLGLGGLGTSALVQYAPAPTHLVWWLLLGACAAAAVAVMAIPETRPKRPGVLASLRPRVAVPGRARGTLAMALPCMIAAPALNGFYLSLGPSLAAQVLHSPDLLWGGLVIFLVGGTAAAATVAFRGLSDLTAMLAGCLALLAGAVMTLTAIETASAAAFLAGTAVAGAGAGTAFFLAAYRILAALASPDQRAGLIAAIWIVYYLAFSVPVVAAGVATTHFGLHQTAVVYSAALAVLAAAAAGSFLFRRRSLGDRPRYLQGAERERWRHRNRRSPQPWPLAHHRQRMAGGSPNLPHLYTTIRRAATADSDELNPAEQASGTRPLAMSRGAVLAATIFTPAVSGGWHTGRARWARTRPERR